jgi:O-antigen/teichoic acid export membrane protein
MQMSNIRVTYSGLLGFIIGMLSVITGIVFTLIVTRRLSPEEFGIWALIGSIISYFLIVEPILSYWTTRQIARGESVATTSLFYSTLFSLGQVPIYISLAFYLPSINIDYSYSLILASILLPVTFVSQTLVGINQGHKPHATSYAFLAFELLKIPAGILFVVLFDLGINGAIFATFVAYVGRLTIQLYFAKPQLKKQLKLYLIKQWIKTSWIPIYHNISHLIWTLDVVIFSIITHSVIGVAYYSITVTISAIISHSGMISQALYPKLLSNGNKDHVADNFIRFMYFAVPLLGIVIVFSRPALFSLNPLYEHLSIPVILMGFRSFFYVITSFFYQVLLGTERVDEENTHNFKSLIKSKLFHLPTISLVHHSSYIIILAISTFLLTEQSASDLELVTMWTSISLILSVPFLIYSIILLRKDMTFSLPYNTLFKYLVGTICMILVFLFTSDFIIFYKISIYEFLPGVILEFVLCILTYLGITYLIDKKTRILFRAIVMEFIPRKEK